METRILEVYGVIDLALRELVSDGLDPKRQAKLEKKLKSMNINIEYEMGLLGYQVLMNQSTGRNIYVKPHDELGNVSKVNAANAAANKRKGDDK